MHAFIASSPPDIKNSPDKLEIFPDPSIGIEQIRSIQSFLSKKPISNSQNIVIITSAHTMTHQAQQAFLKTLEEPPPDAVIYLVTQFSDQLLPTILSRVQNLDKNHNTSTSIDPNSQELIKKLLTSKVGGRLQLIEDQKFTRDTAQELLNQMEIYLHHNLHSPNAAKLLSLIVQTREYLKSNSNLRLTLDFFVLNIDQI